MSDISIVDVSEVSIIAFLSYYMQDFYYFFLTQKGIKAKLRELLREIVGRNVYEPIVWFGFRGWLRRHGQTANDQTVGAIIHVLVKDDLIHAFGKFKAHFREKGCSVRGGFASKSLGVLC